MAAVLEAGKNAVANLANFVMQRVDSTRQVFLPREPLSEEHEVEALVKERFEQPLETDKNRVYGKVRELAKEISIFVKSSRNKP